MPLCSAPGRPHLQCCAQAWGPQDRRDVELLEGCGAPEEGTRMLRGLQHLCCEARLHSIPSFTVYPALEVEISLS